MKRTILHLDFDSFFASVEQQDNPQFRNKPLGVTAHNGRTAIIAASREAKKMGIKSPCRVYDAQKLCPNLLLSTSHFTRYWEVSKIFIKICNDFSPYIEVFSLDELFMDITYSAHLFGGTEGVIEKIKNRIKKEIGEYVTVSVGISHNRLLAKLASGWKKPDGVFEIKKDDVDAVYAEAKLTDICGIGFRLERRLAAMGIYTLLKLAQTPLQYLIAEFGNVCGTSLKNISLGVDMSPVRPFTSAPDVKSVGRNYCLPHNEYDERIVLQNFYELWEEVCIKLRRLKKKARTIGFMLRGTDDLSGRKTYSSYFNSGKDMFDASLDILRASPMQYRTSREGLKYNSSRLRSNNIIFEGYTRQIGVWASSLEDEKNITLSLFDHTVSNPKLLETIDRINEKYGDHTIRNGYLLYADKLTTVPNGFMGDRFERTKLAEETEHTDEMRYTRVPFAY